MKTLADNNQPNVDKGRKLNEGELEELRSGQSVYEMTQTSGWKVVEGWLQDMAYHSWVDPLETDSEKQWVWRELNAYHAANIAKQFIDNIQKAIDRGDYLDKVSKGVIEERRMKI